MRRCSGGVYIYIKLRRHVNMKKLITTEGGFTLIELMIVVAIIGILSVVAIPTFDGYQKKARGTEAKISLSNIFTGEKSFHAEFNVYCADLKAVGAENDNQKYYTTGFAASGNNDDSSVNALCDEAITGDKSINKAATASGAPPAHNATCVTAAAGFLACAYAGIDASVDQHWSINQDKELAVAPGAAAP